MWSFSEYKDAALLMLGHISPSIESGGTKLIFINMAH